VRLGMFYFLINAEARRFVGLGGALVFLLSLGVGREAVFVN
jgi:hypothetical protein